MRKRRHFIPVSEARAGMVLSTPISISSRGYLCLTLPAGHVLNENSLRQLIAHSAEFLYISETDTRSPEAIAAEAAATSRRVMSVFAGADMRDPNMAALFEQVRLYRSE